MKNIRIIQILLIFLGFEVPLFGTSNPKIEHKFAWPLPFSENEIAEFKKSGVKGIFYRNGDDQWTVFEFNEKGQLTYEQTKTSKGKQYSEGKYAYNKDGQLTLAITGNSKQQYYDSIAYNNEGRIICYYSYSKVRVNRKYRKTVYYDARYSKTENGNFILVDTNSLWKSATFTLDVNNKLLKIKSKDYIDSLSIERDTNNLLHVKHWHKYDCIESIYKDDLIIEEIKWPKNKLYQIRYANRKVYNYDNEKKLQSIIPVGMDSDAYSSNYYGPKVFYIYDTRGLLKERITITLERGWKKDKTRVFIEKFWIN